MQFDKKPTQAQAQPPNGPLNCGTFWLTFFLFVLWKVGGLSNCTNKGWCCIEVQEGTRFGDKYWHSFLSVFIIASKKGITSLEHIHVMQFDKKPTQAQDRPPNGPSNCGPLNWLKTYSLTQSHIICTWQLVSWNQKCNCSNDFHFKSIV